ncbi:MAG TPA: hypothetical protein PLB01_13080 [Thermoanaerobaculia bacterium]|nr:hypothetical protein [Thermoanaerobaculia bacterium]
MQSPWLRAALMVLVCAAIYAAGAALLGDWIIDDAGISYAYARNLAAGHGLVSQPGRPPVEGFSNFLWVVLLTPLFLARVFDPVMVVKVLAGLLVLLSVWILQRTLRREPGGWAPALLATALVAGSSPIVIWTASGLENSLTLLLGVVLYDRLVWLPGRWELQAGILTALLAMNHPENLLYIAAGLLVCCGPLLMRRESIAEAARHVGRYVAGFALLFSPFMAFRLATFGLPFPHTYYAKRRFPDAWASLAALFRHPADTARKLLDLLQGIAGPLGLVAMIVTAAAALHLLRRRTVDRTFGVALAIQAVAIGAYLWMDEDWMGEYRFATLATAFSLVSFVIAGFSILARPSGRGRLLVTAAYTGAAAFLLARGARRIVDFAQAPPAPFAEMARQHAFKFNVYADVLGLRHASLLLPDIGAALVYSDLTVYDAAGLCEPDVVRTLKGGTIYWLDHHPAFYDWVFETVRPTFINTHDFFTHVTALERDPRFARDYAAVNEYRDEYVARMYGWAAHSGDYVRRDALRSPADLEALRRSYEPLPPLRPPFEVLRARYPF